MKLLYILLCTNLLFAQGAQETVLLTLPYSSLPAPVRITHSGVYGITAFSASRDGMFFSMEQRPEIFFAGKSVPVPLVADNAPVSLLDKSLKGGSVLKKNFAADNESFSGADGEYINASGEVMTCAISGYNTFEVRASVRQNTVTITGSTEQKIAAVDIVGADAEGNLFIITESYYSEVPLRINRQLQVISNSGRLLSRLDIPLLKGMAIPSEFDVDSAGNFYHVLSDRTSLYLLRWSGLTLSTGGHYQYPAKFLQTSHYNSYLPVDEAAVPPVVLGTEAAASRVTAVRMAETYVLYRYKCSSVNLAPSPVKDAGGDTVETPPRLVTGANAKVPYKWGGFNTLAQYLSGINSGKYAGDIHTAGVSSYSVGVDCSGFLSRCWQMSSHYSTSAMPGITTLYPSWDSLKPGDAIHKVGHVRMFLKKNPNGSLKTVEASARDWGVSYWSYLPSDLTEYTPRYYNNMEAGYTTLQPKLVSARLVSANEVELVWNADTAGVKGYRVYQSDDGSNWVMLLSENSVKTTTVRVPQTSGLKHYRVAGVLNNSTATEGNWSNTVVVKNPGTVTKRILIVDGFDREIGDWRGAGHTFVSRYAAAVDSAGICIESLHHKNITAGILAQYSVIFWIAGDQSTLDSTITPVEQLLLQAYLESGGALFISGSEIGWDLFNKGSVADKDFYTKYLKAQYVKDDAGSEQFTGTAGSMFNGLSGRFAQVYEVQFPDQIANFNGSNAVLQYANGGIAGISFAGTFGSSVKKGRIVYIAFPVETIADDTTFYRMLKTSRQFLLDNASGVQTSGLAPLTASLEQNYPNPFNPSTVVSFTVPESGPVTLQVYTVLGELLGTPVRSTMQPGTYSVSLGAEMFNRHGSGVYFYVLQTAGKHFSKKMIFVK